jgi:hypothetical protein
MAHAAGILGPFKAFFADPAAKKVWHNYGFDRHVMAGIGVEMGGFYGDTMHMARLWDASRKLSGGYSLENLSNEKVGGRGVWRRGGGVGGVGQRTMCWRWGVGKGQTWVQGRICACPCKVVPLITCPPAACSFMPLLLHDHQLLLLLLLMLMMMTSSRHPLVHLCLLMCVRDAVCG